ncbi:MAG: hypothetical protein ACRDUA_26330, partial [Micromonosporaceae bacterium]
PHPAAVPLMASGWQPMPPGVGWHAVPGAGYPSPQPALDAHLAAAARAVEGLAVQLAHLTGVQTQLMQQFSHLIAQQQALLDAVRQQSVVDAARQAQDGR